MKQDELIEAMARLFYECAPYCNHDPLRHKLGEWETVPFEQAPEWHLNRARERARALIPIIRAHLEPTSEMWGELARHLMMAYDLDAKTPRSIFAHLERVGCEIPTWLRDEPEMKALDHTVSKGTRAVVVYKAMLAASPIGEIG